jgi:hypothetical protein
VSINVIAADSRSWLLLVVQIGTEEEAKSS